MSEEHTVGEALQTIRETFHQSGAEWIQATAFRNEVNRRLPHRLGPMNFALLAEGAGLQRIRRWGGIFYGNPQPPPGS